MGVNAMSICFKVEEGDEHIFMRIYKDKVELIVGSEVVKEYTRDFFDLFVETYLVEGAKVREK